MPRGLRKRNILAEVARFALIPSGKKVLRESYQQLRKYNVWNVATVQELRVIQILGDSRTGARQQSHPVFPAAERPLDIEDLSQDFPIPGAVKDAVMRHPEPEKIMGEKYSQFTYYHTDERRPMIVTMRNAASREMLYCASSSGAHYDQREKELKGYRKRDSQPHLVRPVLK